MSPPRSLFSLHFRLAGFALRHQSALKCAHDTSKSLAARNSQLSIINYPLSSSLPRHGNRPAKPQQRRAKEQRADSDEDHELRPDHIETGAAIDNRLG